MKNLTWIVPVAFLGLSSIACDNLQRCDESLIGRQLSKLPLDEHCIVYGSAAQWYDSPACLELDNEEWTCIDVRAAMGDGIGTDRYGNECGTGNPPTSDVICNVWADPETGEIVCVNYWCPD